MSTHYEVIVVGGGASGMMAAGRAAERGKRVLLLEKNKELGKKLSITGGGRCNITNAEDDTRTFLKHFADAEQFLYSPFSKFGIKDTFTFFEEKGLPLVVESRKRAFPVTQKAPDVTRVLRDYLSKHHVTVLTGVRVDAFVHNEHTITGVKTNKGEFTGDAFMLATGGSSHQETGSTGEGISWLRGLGHTVHEPNPDIVPLIVKDEWVKVLSGTALSFMKVTFTDGVKKVSRTGKILFTHFGFSGPLILNAAREVKELLQAGDVAATIDLYPDTDLGTVRNRVLALFDEHKNKQLKNILKDILPKGMLKAFVVILPEELLERKVHEVTKEDRNRLADLLKGMPATVTGTMGFDWAVVSDGGVDLKEVDTKTMQSKLYNNLYLIGDVLNISRPSGGYSLQLCWTTGWVAGSSV